MKIIKIFFAVVLITIGVCKIEATQADSAFYFAEGTTWTMAHYSYESGCEEWKLSYTIHGDTLIGSNLYQKIIFTYDNRVDALDQGTVIPVRTENNEKLYARLGNTDYLLCDFSLEVGDTVPVYGFDVPNNFFVLIDYSTINYIDTITLLDGRSAKQIHYLGRLPDIEFIGGSYGLFTSFSLPALTTCGGADMCCSLNGEPIYETSPGTCARLNSKVTPPVCADTWHAIVYKWSLVKASEADDVVYSLASDTVIGDYTYRKLMQNDTICVGGLRQTDNGMKVYYYDMVSPSDWPFSHVDCLLFDFSANVGDTIKDAYYRQEDFYSDVVEPQTIGWRVTAKDTIDGRIYMTVARFDSLDVIGAQHETLWIQGIGTANVIWPYEYGLPGNGSFNTLYTLCALSGDEVLYSYDLDIIGIINNCTEWHFKDDALNDTPSDVTGARKFLRDGHMFISTPIGTFDATGKLVE